VNPEHLFTHFRHLTKALSAKQLTGLAAIFLAVVGVVVGSAYWISTPEYTLLVADMDAETASSVVGRLKAAKVPYELSDGGRNVSVPQERVDELRLEFASGGLPSAGRIGFEIFDRTAFGTTEFLEHVNYRRALEGELARTIGTLAEVASARVHIAMAKDSLFLDQAQPAKASVVLRLKSSRPLAPATVRGIASLVSGSVEALRPESVMILDHLGRPLNRQADGEDAALNALQLDRQQQIERDLSSRVVSLLEPVVGGGRVRVNVAAYLKPDIVEETEERWDPNAVVRSRQTSTETGSMGSMAGGVAGARANQPPALSTAPASTTPAAGAASVAAEGTASNAGAASTPNADIRNAAVLPMPPGRTSETTNYEIGRVTRHTVSPQGQLARLSVAVILDDERVSTKKEDGTVTTTTRAWDPDGLQRVQALVAAAVGLDPDRGDQLTVENIAFETVAETPEPTPPGIGQQVLEVGKNYWPQALRGLAIVTIALVALFGVLRPLARRAAALAAPAPALPQVAGASPSPRLPTVQEMEGQIDAELDALAAPGGRRLPVLTQRVAKLANEEPEQLARIVRGWIAEEPR
jgi:flagellar M-ring protein FliF